MDNLQCFAPVELYFLDREKMTKSRFAIVDNMPGLLDVLQLVLDSCTTGLADVAGLDTLTGRMFRVDTLAARHGMRKRTFDERMEGKRVYSLEVIK